MLSKEDILFKLREIKPALIDEYSVRRIGLFGSFIDGSNTEDSDIDLLIEFEKPIGWKFFSLELYLEEYLGRKIDLVTKNALKSQIRDQILNQIQYV